MQLLYHKYGSSALYQVYDSVNLTMMTQSNHLPTILGLMYDCWCLNVSDLFGRISETR
jgi:hypothetical protein